MHGKSHRMNIFKKARSVFSFSPTCSTYQKIQGEKKYQDRGKAGSILPVLADEWLQHRFEDFFKVIDSAVQKYIESKWCVS
jgi:hypothetical protein